jgi:hypothetical protein
LSVQSRQNSGAADALHAYSLHHVAARFVNGLAYPGDLNISGVAVVGRASDFSSLVSF